MPRSLPWATSKVSEKSSLSAHRVVPQSAPRKYARKRERSASGSNDSESESPQKDHTDKRRISRGASTSPLPQAPTESFMITGLEHDDKFRMVEDEFLAIANKFTTHLHAAEYKRLRKVAKARNAQAITSIARPVVGEMPAHTRRRVESIAQSMKQQTMIDDLLIDRVTKAEEGVEDSEDAKDLPYLGTSLHHLMDSPRKRANALAKLGLGTAATRAAAGFQKPAENMTKSSLKTEPTTNVHGATHEAILNISELGDQSTDSSGDDDLDRPVHASKSISFRDYLEKSPLKFRTLLDQ